MQRTAAAQDGFEDETVSVIIPFCDVYTSDEMLTQALRSVEEQSGVETEVIVVEDPDERGPAWARNAGLERADTRYAAFLDADDVWRQEKLRRQLREMKETGAGMCVDGREEYSPVEFVGALLTAETFGLTSSITIDTEQVDARFDESLERREDHLYMIEAASQGGVCFTPDTFIARDNEDGLSKHVDSSYEQIVEFFRKVTGRVPEAERFRRPYFQNSLIYLGRLRLEDGEYPAALRYFVESLGYGVSVKGVGGIGLTLLTAVYRLSRRQIRSRLAGGAHD